MTRFQATVPPAMMTFESQVAQYADAVIDPGGITYFRGVLDTERWVDCLLYWNADGELVGILNHYPQDLPWERAGNINVFVRPDHYRRGIATRLVDDALLRFHVDLPGQDLTPLGARFLTAYLRPKDRA
jgi:GNAT superfamily N-acetyltransferase